MKYEDLKAEFAKLTGQDKQRFMEEVGFGLCQEMMRDKKCMERMLPCCEAMMKQMPEPFRRWMEEWMEPAAPGRKA